MKRSAKPLTVRIPPKPYGAWRSAEERAAWFAALRAPASAKTKLGRDA